MLNMIHSGIFLKCVSFLFLVFPIYFVSAQDYVNPQNRDPASVIIIKGGMIFSSDESFNQQILERKVIIIGSDVSYSNSKRYVISKQKTKKADKTFIAQVKDAHVEKTKKDLQDINREIVRYESRKKSFQHKNINVPLSSEQFSNVQRGRKDYITPASFQYKVEKTAGKNFYFNIETALGDRYSDHYRYYSSLPLTQCYAVIFSVRPPPFFIS